MAAAGGLAKLTGHGDVDGDAALSVSGLTPVHPRVKLVKHTNGALGPVRVSPSHCTLSIHHHGRVPLDPPFGGVAGLPTAQRDALIPKEVGPVRIHSQTSCKKQNDKDQ